MPPKAANKAPKKSKKQPTTLPIKTTIAIVRRRNKLLDLKSKVGDKTDDISQERNQDIILKRLEKADLYSSSCLSFRKYNLMNIDFMEHSLTRTHSHSLRALDLAKNNLYSCSTIFKILSGLGALEKLNLSHNCLNGELVIMQTCLPDLEELDISSNQITQISMGAQEWKRIRKVNLSYNLISKFPEVVLTWKNLEELNMRGNRLNALPESCFDSLELLEKLSLGNNMITDIAPSIGTLTRLRELDLSSNQISTLPIELSRCSHLEILYLGSNKLTDLPVEIFSSLTNLRKLQLFKNKLTDIPADGISQLVNLQLLSLSSNNIKKLPEELGNCVNMHEIYLNNNLKLSGLPDALGNLEQLKTLSATKCTGIKNLPSSIGNLQHIKYIDMRTLKKAVCKVTPDVADELQSRQCMIQGVVVKKAKKSKGISNNKKKIK